VVQIVVIDCLHTSIHGLSIGHIYNKGVATPVYVLAPPPAPTRSLMADYDIQTARSKIIKYILEDFFSLQNLPEKQYNLHTVHIIL
jgi:hypothetical protein